MPRMNLSPFVPSEVEGRETGAALVARASTALGTNGSRPEEEE